MTPTEVVAAAMPNRETLRTAIADAAKFVRFISHDPELAEQLGSSLERLAFAWVRHVADTEAPEGLLSDLAEKAPRLCPAVEELRHDHRALAEELRALRLRVKAEDGHPTAPTCQEIGSLLQMMVHHDEMGAELIWEAYNVDIGGGA